MDIQYRNGGSFKYVFVLNVEGLEIMLHIGDYEDEILRRYIPKDIIVKKEIIWLKISNFTFVCKNEGGFSPLDIWRCLYEELTKETNRECVLGNPNVIEIVNYDAAINVVEILMSS